MDISVQLKVIKNINNGKTEAFSKYDMYRDKTHNILKN